MPLYEFWCGCGAVRGKVRPMGKAPSWLKCRVCGLRMNRDFRINVGVFEPFECSDFNGSPILVTSSKHRDELCRQFRVTPDRSDYSKPKKRKTVAESLDYQEVKDALQRCSDDDLARIRERDSIERRDPERGKIPTKEVLTE